MMLVDKHANEQKVAQTLQVLDELENIQCSPDFYIRLQAKINSSQAKKRALQPLIVQFRRFLLPTTLALLIILNMFIVISALTTSSANETQTAERQRNLTSFSEKYSLTQRRINSWIIEE